MASQRKRNVLLPWFVGVAIIAATDAYVAFQLFALSCPAPTFPKLTVVLIMPLVYIWLMYLTFKSEA